jgi:hypothetical protein
MTTNRKNPNHQESEVAAAARDMPEGLAGVRDAEMLDLRRRLAIRRLF